MQDRHHTAHPWVKILQDNLIQFPPKGNEYHSPENLVVTIKVKKMVATRQYTFGGPHWSGSLYFSEKEIALTYLSPLKKPQNIPIESIIEIGIRYI